MSKPKTIYKIEKHCKNFSIIDNRIFSSGLYPSSIAIIVILLSKPEDWVISKQYFINNHKFTRREVDASFKELEDKGYLKTWDVAKTRDNQSGKTYTVYEKPIEDNFINKN